MTVSDGSVQKKHFLELIIGNRAKQFNCLGLMTRCSVTCVRSSYDESQPKQGVRPQSFFFCMFHSLFWLTIIRLKRSRARTHTALLLDRLLELFVPHLGSTLARFGCWLKKFDQRNNQESLLNKTYRLFKLIGYFRALLLIYGPTGYVKQCC